MENVTEPQSGGETRHEREAANAVVSEIERQLLALAPTGDLKTTAEMQNIIEVNVIAQALAAAREDERRRLVKLLDSIPPNDGGQLLLKRNFKRAIEAQEHNDPAG